MNDRLAETFDILVEMMGLGYDCAFTEPVPQWFFDALVAACVRHGDGTEEEVSETLTMEGWTVT